MPTLRVFVNEKGEFGNPHQIVFDEERKLTTLERQSVAHVSGFSETVFVNNQKTGKVSIYNPLEECPFAGSALLAASALLQPIDKLITNGVVIPTWQEGKLIFIRMNKSTFPPWNLEQLENPELVEKITSEQMQNREHVFIWAWIDEEKGLIRARTFANDWGIPEDEANGSGAMKLADKLQREITIIHGKRSVIQARPAKDNCAEVGGLVTMVNHS